LASRRIHTSKAVPHTALQKKLLIISFIKVHFWLAFYNNENDSKLAIVSQSAGGMLLIPCLDTRSLS